METLQADAANICVERDRRGSKFNRVLPALVPVGLYQQVQHSDLSKTSKTPLFTLPSQCPVFQCSIKVLPWQPGLPLQVHCGSLLDCSYSLICLIVMAGQVNYYHLTSLLSRTPGSQVCLVSWSSCSHCVHSEVMWSCVAGAGRLQCWTGLELSQTRGEL